MLSFIVLTYSVFLDSKSMAKLRAAVEGKDRQNMKDLKHMTACMDTSRWVLRTINFMCMVFPYKSKTLQVRKSCLETQLQKMEKKRKQL